MDQSESIKQLAFAHPQPIINQRWTWVTVRYDRTTAGLNLTEQ